MANRNTPDWPAALLANSPWFTALRPTLNTLGWRRFPGFDDWAALPSVQRPSTAAGMPIQFVDADTLTPEAYERRIGTEGVVATRAMNWHDTFNALCWLSWPRSKAALNASHMREFARQAGLARTPPRDAATLLDESGLILACADAALTQALLDHDWNTLFVARADAWDKHIAAFCLGHALLEKGLAPFVGIIGKCVVIPVAADWFMQAPAAQLVDLDAQLAQRIDRDEFVSPRTLPPMPILGIPGWWPAQTTAFYADRQHFR